MPNHQWTKDNTILVATICKATVDKKDRLRILQSHFPDCSIEDINFQITRYQKRNDDNTIRYISEQGKIRGYRANERLHY